MKYMSLLTLGKKDTNLKERKPKCFLKTNWEVVAIEGI